MEVRVAGKKDLSSICRMYEEFYAYNAHKQPDFYRPAEENGSYPEKAMANETSVLFLAVENETAVAFLHAEEQQTPPYACLIPHKFAVIVDLYVSPGFRRQGIGTALLKSAREWARKQGLDYLELFVLREAEDAFLMYQREGFQTVSRNMRCFL